MRFLLLIFILLTAPAGLSTVMAAGSGRVERTTRKIPRGEAQATTQAVTAAAATESADSCLVTASEEITLSGYDKPLRSRKESIFATNHSGRHITTLHLTITYRDMQGRELHTRHVSARCDLPPGATRLITFPAWDHQQAFYYRLSSRPVRADGTPYDITARCDSAIITNRN